MPPQEFRRSDGGYQSGLWARAPAALALFERGGVLTEQSPAARPIPPGLHPAPQARFPSRERFGSPSLTFTARWTVSDETPSSCAAMSRLLPDKRLAALESLVVKIFPHPYQCPLAKRC